MSTGDQRNWVEIHEPRGRPRTIRPSAESSRSTRVETFCLASYGLPSASTIGVRSSGTSWASSAAVASPRLASARMVDSSRSASQRGTSGPMPARSR